MVYFDESFKDTLIDNEFNDEYALHKIIQMENSKAY